MFQLESWIMAINTAPQRSWAWLWLLSGGALLTQTALNIVRPVTTYKLLDLQADTTTIGVVTAAYALIPLLSALSFGRLSDRVSDLRWLVAGGAAVLGVGAIALALAPTIGLIAAANALLGLGHLIFTIAGQTVITRFARPTMMNAAFGWFTAAFSAGQLIGPLVAGLLLVAEPGNTGQGRASGIALALWSGAAISLLAVPFMLIRIGPRGSGGTTADGEAGAGDGAGTALEPPTAHSPTDLDVAGADADDASAGIRPGSVERPVNADSKDAPSQDAATLAGVLRHRGIPSHMLASLSLLAMLDILTAFLPLAAEEAGVSPVYVGGLLAIRGAASILSRSCLPWLSSRLSSRTLLLISLYGSGTALIFPPITLTQSWLVIPLLLVGGFCLGLGQPITMTLVSTAVPLHWRGTALAVRLTGNRVGQVAVPIAAGFLAAPLGAAGAIWFSCAILIASACEKTIHSDH